MQQQTAESIEPRKLARKTDPDTSHEAASHVAEFGARQHAVIAQVLRNHGEQTAHEIAEHCAMLPHAILKRLEEMRRAGLAELVMVNDRPLTRKATSGRSARVWKAPAA